MTFIVLGDVHRVPRTGVTKFFPKSRPSHAALTQARIEAVSHVESEFFSIVDGGEDVLLPCFEDAMQELCSTMDAIGADIGTAREQVRGQPSRYMHHGIMCRTSAFRALKLPKSGCFDFAAMVYPMLSSNGCAICHQEAYNWIPSHNGARLWHDTPRARVNAARWAAGLPPVLSRKYDMDARQ